MKVNQLLPSSLLCIVFLMLSGHVLAEKSQDFGDYIVHYNAFTTNTLQPKIAKLYDIRRSKNRGMVNISVQKKIMDTAGKPVHGTVTGTASNLTGQLRTIKLREITEDTAIYYIGDFTIEHRETLNFTFQIKLKDKQKPLTVKFRQQFFTR